MESVGERRACPVSSGSHCSALEVAAVHEAGLVPASLSTSGANLYTVVFISQEHIQTFK